MGLSARHEGTWLGAATSTAAAPDRRRNLRQKFNNAATLLLRSLAVLPQGDRNVKQLPGNESAY